jgi:lipoate-protein ligase B
VGDSKIASIGMAVRRWVVLHGMALNVSTNLNYFTYIDPCGHAGMAVTSMERELGSAPNMCLVASSFARHFCSVFGRVMRSGRPLYESDGIKT